MMTDVIKKRYRESMMARYGAMVAPGTVEHRQATMMERYGVANPFQSKEILEKRRIHNLEKYGVEYTLSLDSVREKIAVTSYLNGTGSYSPEQQHICELYGGILNYPIGKYLVDILLDDSIVVEFDGSGHALTVVYGTYTQEEFDEKEKRRENFILESGYKMIRLIHKRHTVIKDDEYLFALEKCKEQLQHKNISRYSFDTHTLI